MTEYKNLEDVFEENGIFEDLRFGRNQKNEKLCNSLIEYAKNVNQKIKENDEDAKKEILKLEQVLINLSAFSSVDWIEELIIDVYKIQCKEIEIWEE